MEQKEVLELKRRFTKDSCTFQRIRSVYVDSNKQKVTTANSRFLTLSEEEFFKYLEIAKKTLSGKAGDALLDVNMHTGEEGQEKLVKLLNALKESKLEDDTLAEQMFDHIIDTYVSAEPYFIVFYYDAYDVPAKTSDNKKLDESEEVYEYLLCSICPVKMSKPGLGYLEDKNVIGPRNRDWVVQPPVCGFLYPAFNERSTDSNAALFYSKNTKDPDHTFMTQLLGSPMVESKTEKMEKFASILRSSIGNSESTTYNFHEKLNELAEERAGQDQDDIPLTADDVKEVAKEAGMDEELADEISTTYTKAFKNAEPSARMVVDTKLLEQQLVKENAELKNRVAELMNENMRLKEKLGE